MRCTWLESAIRWNQHHHHHCWQTGIPKNCKFRNRTDYVRVDSSIRDQSLGPSLFESPKENLSTKIESQTNAVDPSHCSAGPLEMFAHIRCKSERTALARFIPSAVWNSSRTKKKKFFYFLNHWVESSPSFEFAANWVPHGVCFKKYQTSSWVCVSRYMNVHGSSGKRRTTFHFVCFKLPFVSLE